MLFDFSIIKELLPLITIGGAVVSAAGLVPRIGPGRAVWIALTTRFASKPVRESLRLEEINLLQSKIADKEYGQEYLVVTGEKGVGKTCLVQTVTSKTPGVITVEAQPGIDQDTIIKNTLHHLTQIPFNFIPPFKSAKRVIFWYRLFTLGRAPIIVINATERKIGEEFAGITGAVRILVDKYKLRVIVDGSPNSLDESLFRTKRQLVYDIKPMTKEMIWKMDHLVELFKYIKEAGLDDTVFAVLGGIPADYDALWKNTKTHLQNGQDPRETIGNHLRNEIQSAIKMIEDSCGNDEKSISKLMKVFSEAQVFSKKTLVANGLNRPTPDKIFREVSKVNFPNVLIPASNAIGIVLHHDLTYCPTLNDLEEKIKKM